MKDLKITTKSDVNIRKGPGMVCDVATTVERGRTLICNDAEKDASGMMWFKVPDGWICGKYVTLAKDAQRMSASDIRILWLQRFAEDNDEEEGETVDLTGALVGAGVSALSKTVGSFFDSFGSNKSSEGEDVLLNRRIFGVPFQMLEATDYPRYGGNDDGALGFTYHDMLSEAPILSIIPGNPMFLPDLNDEEKSSVFTKFADYAQKMSGSEDSLDEDNMDVRFFTFSQNFTDYIRYVNTLCAACAVMMGLNDIQMPGGGATYPDYEWQNYALANFLRGRKTSGKTASTGLADAAGDILEKGKAIWDSWTNGSIGIKDAAAEATEAVTEELGSDKYYTDFYIDPRVSYSETFNNQTRESMLAGMVKGAADMAKELSFLLDSGGITAIGNSSEKLTEQLGKAAAQLGSGGSKSFFDRFFKGASTILTGANIVFPQLWTDSQYSKNYNIEIHLKTAYGNKESIFMNIMVPLMHLVALVAPRQNTTNTFSAPFLVNCHVPGIFAVELGIVESLTINKGGDGTAWSVDGLPLEVSVSMNIKDLYNSLSISRVNSITDAYNLMWNDSLIDYLAAMSGVDMKVPSMKKRMQIAEALGKTAITDIYNRPREIIAESVGKFFTGWSSGRG